jgi:Pao retrotransposon peptidase.
LKSLDTPEEAIELIKTLQAALLERGFRLTKFTSNSRAILKSVDPEDMASEFKKLNPDTDLMPLERALGVNWCTETDTLRMQVTIANKEPTRRNILSTVASMFDPLGLIGPVILITRIILQELARSKIDWDSSIPENLARRWRDWLSSTDALERFQVDRRLKPEDFGQIVECQLHHFSDASQVGYGTVCYLRMVNEEGGIHCSIVMAKSRVAPLKQITIPRMELQAAVKAIEMDEKIRAEMTLQLKPSEFWTDSETVLKYIQNDQRRFRMFVSNRVNKIREATSTSQWHYINTKDNPADISSRGQSSKDFVQNRLWIHGPQVLWKAHSN